MVLLRWLEQAQSLFRSPFLRLLPSAKPRTKLLGALKWFKTQQDVLFLTVTTFASCLQVPVGGTYIRICFDVFLVPCGKLSPISFVFFWGAAPLSQICCAHEGVGGIKIEESRCGEQWFIYYEGLWSLVLLLVWT